MNAGTTYSAIVGNVVKQLRAQHSLTQGEMAQKMGLTQAAWSKLESGKSTMSTAQLAKAAKFLKTEASQILLYADRAVTDFAAQGMTVTYDNREAENTGLMLLGAAAVGALIAVIMLSKN